MLGLLNRPRGSRACVCAHDAYCHLADDGGPGQVWSGGATARARLALRSRDPASTPHGVECGGASSLSSLDLGRA